MHNEFYYCMRKEDISFSHKVQMLQAKKNLHLNIPVYSLISPSSVKDGNKININNYCMSHACTSNRKRL